MGGRLTPQGFVEKWSAVKLSEKAASHEHFLDLCALLEQPTPAQADPTGHDYCFEKPVHPIASASRGSKGDLGLVDVWKRGHFAWEYKRKDKYKDLTEAYRQLYQYRDDLDNPPLSVVCDITTTIIHTHFTGYPKREIPIKLEKTPSARVRDTLGGMPLTPRFWTKIKGRTGRYPARRSGREVRIAAKPAPCRRMCHAPLQLS